MWKKALSEALEVLKKDPSKTKEALSAIRGVLGMAKWLPLTALQALGLPAKFTPLLAEDADEPHALIGLIELDLDYLEAHPKLLIRLLQSLSA